jgi:hypothetical protein
MKPTETHNGVPYGETTLMRIVLASLLSCSLLVLAPIAASAAPPFYDSLGALGDVYEDDDTFFLIGDHTLTLGGADWFQGLRFTAARTGRLYSIDVGSVTSWRPT